MKNAAYEFGLKEGLQADHCEAYDAGWEAGYDDGWAGEVQPRDQEQLGFEAGCVVNHEDAYEAGYEAGYRQGCEEVATT